MSFTRKERDSLGAQSKESSGVQIQSHSQSNPRSQTPIAIRGDGSIQREDTGYKSIGLLKLRGKSDDLPQSWWFASTAIPLAAATIGPLANILSIAAIVSNWIDALPNNGQLPEGADENGVGIPDPTWSVQARNKGMVLIVCVGRLCSMLAPWSAVLSAIFSCS